MKPNRIGFNTPVAQPETRDAEAAAPAAGRAFAARHLGGATAPLDLNRAPTRQDVSENQRPRSATPALAPTRFGAALSSQPGHEQPVIPREILIRGSNLEGRARRAPDEALRGLGASAGRGMSPARRPSSDSSVASHASQMSHLSSSSSVYGENLRNSMVKAIAEIVAKEGFPPLSREEQEVSKSFVVDRHIQAIGMAAKKMNFAVSIRDSGESTLRCLKLGAAAKGHDILEKTIKPSSLNTAYSKNNNDVFNMIKEAKIDGYVGHWAADGHLIGIYMGPEAEDETKNSSLASALLKTESGKSYYPVDMENLEESLVTLKSSENWGSIPFTGDYDLHDMISYSGVRAQAGQNSAEEKRILLAINASIVPVDPQMRPVDSEHKNVVRHGPQNNFVAHMLSAEGERSFPGAVAMPSFPLAMCDRGDWSIINDIAQLRQFHSNRGLRLKVTWDKPEEHFESVGGGQVSLRRSFGTNTGGSISGRSISAQSGSARSDSSISSSESVGTIESGPSNPQIDLSFRDITERSEDSDRES